jgi:predicted transcriptional regulator
MHTLATIAESEGVKKRTVQNWLKKATKAEGQELGSVRAGTRVFSDDDRNLLLQFKSLKTRVELPEPVMQVQVFEGNHHMVQADPIIPVSYDLGDFRSETQIVTIEDPMAIALQFCGAADQLVAAMQSSANGQRDKLQQTIAATQMIEAKAAEVERSRVKYEVLSEVRGDTQNLATAGLNALVGKLQALGSGGG